MASKAEVARGKKLSLALCPVFGLDPGLTRSITLTLAYDSPPILSVERFVTTDEEDKVSDLLRQEERRLVEEES